MFEWIKNLRSTEKGRTLFKFILYMVFFTSVVLLIIITNAVTPPRQTTRHASSSLVTTPEKKEELSYPEKQEKLLKGTYDFYYKITSNRIIEYTGSFANGKVEGFRETEDELIRYTIEDGVVYKKDIQESLPYEELYLDLDSTLFDFTTLFAKLNSTGAQIIRNGEEKIYNYQLDDYTYKISTNANTITAIDINTKTDQYSYTFEY